MSTISFRTAEVVFDRTPGRLERRLCGCHSYISDKNIIKHCYLGVTGVSVVGSLDTPSTLSHSCLSAVINVINTKLPMI